MPTRPTRPNQPSRPTGRNQPTGQRARHAPTPPDPLLELVVAEFLYACQQSLSPESERSYRGVLRVFSAFLTEQLDGRPPRLGDFTLPAVQRWAMSLQQRPKWERGGLAAGAKPVTVETRRTYLRTLRTFSNWLPKPPHVYCDEPPLRHLLLPRASDTFKLPLSDDELARLLEASKEDSVFGARDYAMLLLLVDGAVRAAELCGLRIGDVTLQTGLLLVARGKGNKTRAVTVGDETRLALRRYAVLRDSWPGADRSPEAPFFQSVYHRTFSYHGLRSWLKRIAQRAEVPRVHLHLLRHTSAVDTLDAGADVRTVQLKLGHASIATTQRYLHMASRQLSERQKATSPIDRLRQTQGTRGTKGQRGTTQPRTPLWRRAEAPAKPAGDEGEEAP